MLESQWSCAWQGNAVLSGRENLGSEASLAQLCHGGGMEQQWASLTLSFLI